MHDPSRLAVDLTLPLWVIGVFVVSMLALRVVESFAHTRARNRTRLAIETTTASLSENTKKTTDSQAMN